MPRSSVTRVLMGTRMLRALDTSVTVAAVSARYVVASETPSFGSS